MTTIDTEGELEIWFWNEIANTTNLHTEEEGDDVELALEESRRERAVSPEVFKTQIKWNKEGVVHTGDLHTTAYTQGTYTQGTYTRGMNCGHTHGAT